MELANFVVSSDILNNCWAAIWDPHNVNNLGESSSSGEIRYKVIQQQRGSSSSSSSSANTVTIIAFVYSPTNKIHALPPPEESDGLVSSASLKETFPFLEFMCTQFNPTFSINKAAIDLFACLYGQLSLLKDQLVNSGPVLITGQSLGGWVASLFTLWLLDNISLKVRPLCITFGSPLLGDQGFQRAILERPTWNSCFLHIVSNQDPIHKSFILSSSAPNLEASFCKPFGTYLICSESSCSCFEDPETVLEVMVAMSLKSTENQFPHEGPQFIHYGRVLECISYKALFGGITLQDDWDANPLCAGVTLELAAAGVVNLEQQVGGDAKAFVTKIGRRKEDFLIRKKNVSDPNKILNDRKTDMAYLEWYKKVTAETGGYYDSYKNAMSKTRDEIKSKLEIVKRQRKLTQYWKKKVEEAGKVPQKEGAFLRTRYLGAGTNYRRMVEPLDIAEYYRGNKRNYITQGRSKHYVLLEQWLNDEKPTRNQQNGEERKHATSLTEDSCFWAHVEEAIICCSVLKNEESNLEDKESASENLIKFEQYVIDLIRNYAVSPEVFLKQSSFMHWWREYEKIRGASHNSLLTDFLRNHVSSYS